MIVQIWIIIDPKGDRPYVSTAAPTAERREALKSQGCEIYLANIVLPEPLGVRSTRVTSVGPR